ncbi:hypothetical protein BC936DRAFT_143382 [Jimgerdemannia flammicorona]|uniref:Uncharacterized protein n=1 Tax=Jimgerdemannia flammicorona TaxID=994334 RepID=A0A432ZZ63_9FUNG|nr:hypothetical protein BC936DRAFT_143382 [Jimgerdemannia flammicorona]
MNIHFIFFITVYIITLPATIADFEIGFIVDDFKAYWEAIAGVTISIQDFVFQNLNIKSFEDFRAYWEVMPNAIADYEFFDAEQQKNLDQLKRELKEFHINTFYDLFKALDEYRRLLERNPFSIENLRNT